MDCSLRTFSVARVFMALAVFFCHVFEPFNYLGFLFVSVFFFMSGYGMEFSCYRHIALRRLVPYLLYFGWFTFLYFLFFRVFPYPSSWFLVMYFLIMLVYRFVSSFRILCISLVLLGLFLPLIGFEFGWCTSFGSFLLGVWLGRDVHRNLPKLTFKNTLLFTPLLLLSSFGIQISLWGILPLFILLVMKFSSLRIFGSLGFLGQYTFFFYCIHCFVLGIFGSTWTLGGEPSLYPVFLAFVVSCVFSFFFKDYLFKYPRLI